MGTAAPQGATLQGRRHTPAVAGNPALREARSRNRGTRAAATGASDDAADDPGPPAADPGQRPISAAGGRASEQEPERLERTEEETEQLEDFRERVLRRNPYKLDKWGILNVPELGPIPLAGLTVEEATQRIAAELRLADFVVMITRLPLKPVGTQALKPFGYDLFSGVPSTFAPATDVPVPAEYVVGPGDKIQVQLIGNTQGPLFARRRSRRAHQLSRSSVRSRSAVGASRKSARISRRACASR